MFAGIMTGSHHTRTAILVGVACLLTSAAYAQHDFREYSLSPHSSIVGAAYVGEPAGTWKVYREQMDEVEIAFSLGNTGEDALFFNSGIIERGMHFRLFSVDDATGERQEIAVRVTPRGILDQDGSGPFITVPDQLVLAEGRNSPEGRRSKVVWIVAVTQADGRPFPPGRYQFETEKRDIRSALVPASGERLPDGALTHWSGVTRGDVGLIIAAPSTPSDVALMYMMQGDVAFERRQFDDAVTLFRQATDADPSSPGRALQRLAGTYLTMGRYAEALPVLKRIPLQSQGAARMVEGYLVWAYVGLGNEAEAMNLLRRGGRSEEDVADQVAQARANIRQRSAR